MPSIKQRHIDIQNSLLDTKNDPLNIRIEIYKLCEEYNKIIEELQQEVIQKDNKMNKLQEDLRILGGSCDESGYGDS